MILVTTIILPHKNTRYIEIASGTVCLRPAGNFYVFSYKDRNTIYAI